MVSKKVDKKNKKKVVDKITNEKPLKIKGSFDDIIMIIFKKGSIKSKKK